jgi:hypothetical protein
MMCWLCKATETIYILCGFIIPAHHNLNNQQLKLDRQRTSTNHLGYDVLEKENKDNI